MLSWSSLRNLMQAVADEYVYDTQTAKLTPSMHIPVPTRQVLCPAAAHVLACLARRCGVRRRCAGAGQAAADGAAGQAAGRSAAAGRQPPAIKQIALTEKQIEGVLAAQKDMDAITDKLPDDAKPDPKIDAQLDGVAKKNGFASYDDYNNVVDNISLVLGGFDPATKKYVGTEAVIKAQIAQVQADKKMSAKDKKDTLADLNEALKQPPPAIENKGNIDLVGKYYDKLSEALGGDE